jgi:organic hydroperoxide reductase OsmC/OhrA
MVMHRDGSGEFTSVLLRPQIRVTAESDRQEAARLHEEAHRFCFIARSMNFPVRIEPVIASD